MILSKTKLILAVTLVSLCGCKQVSADYAEEYCDDFEARARADDAHAQVELANCYIVGKGREIDYPTAEEWLQRAVILGDSKAPIALASLILFKLNDESRYEVAISLLQGADRKLVHQSAFLLGVAYRNGMGIKEDKLESQRLFVVAAKNGHVLSKFVVFGIHALDRNALNDGLDIDYWRRQFEEALPSIRIISSDEFVEKARDDPLILNYIFSTAELDRISERL